MSNTSVLKDSLYILYKDSPEILYALSQVDFTQLNTKFQAELDQRIDRTTYQKVEDFLATPEYLLYCESIQSASMAMTQDLAKLIEFVLDKPKGEVN